MVRRQIAAGRVLHCTKPVIAPGNSFRMHYEHLVQINDSSDTRIEPLTRAQLWLGLVARAERPQYFLAGMDECRISERTANTLRRDMRFGTARVLDQVTYEAPVQVRFDVEGTVQMPGATLAIRIEEPQPGQLFLRFTYALQVMADDAVGDIDEYRKSAYRGADIDTVRIIRQLAASGLLSEGEPEAVDLQ